MATTQTSPPVGAPVAAPTARMKRIRAPWLIAGGMLLAVAVLGSVFLYGQVAAKTEYLVVARDIPRGDVITQQDLDLAYINNDQAINAFGPGERDLVIGQRAIASIPTGALVQPGMFTSRPDIPPGTTLIGAIARAGDFPIGSISQGDLMALVLMPENNRIADTDGSVRPVFEVARPEVYRLDPMNNAGTQQFFTFAVDEDRAALVSALIRENRLRMVQVDEDTPPVRFLPIDAVELFTNLTSELFATRDTVIHGDDGAIFIDGLGIAILNDVALNALTGEAAQAYEDQLEEVENDPDLTVWVDQNRDGIDDDEDTPIPAEVLLYYAPSLVDLGIEPGDLFGVGQGDFGFDPGFDDELDDFGDEFADDLPFDDATDNG